MTDIKRILVVPDAHDTYHDRDKERFHLLGKYILKNQPELIVLIGDFLTMDSLNAHDDNDSLNGKYKPTLKQDILSGTAALEATFKYINEYNALRGIQKKKRYQPQVVITLGNHDDDQGGTGRGRWDRYVQKNPELAGLKPISDLYQSYGIETVPYGKFFKYGDVVFTHVPFTGGNQPITGMNICRKALANVFEKVVVFGHVHTPESLTVTANSADRDEFSRTAICVGSYCPRESYTSPGPCGWGCNLVDLTLVNNRYVSHKFTSYEELLAEFA
jgi:predicted phosphodiesterase